MLDMAMIYIFGIAQVIVQLYTAYLSLKIYNFNRIEKNWLAVTLGMLVMAIGKAVYLIKDINTIVTSEVDVIDSVLLPFIISVMLLIGVASMLKQFTSFEIIEKKVKEHVARHMQRKNK